MCKVCVVFLTRLCLLCVCVFECVCFHQNGLLFIKKLRNCVHFSDVSLMALIRLFRDMCCAQLRCAP